MAVAIAFIIIFPAIVTSEPEVPVIENNIGALGDVKWSVLAPSAFRKENGNGWMLMAGDDVSGTDLATFMPSIPDARGCFIRALNGVVQPSGEMTGLRADGKQDPEGDKRTVGSWQGDAFKQHSHPIKRFQHRDNPGDQPKSPYWDVFHSLQTTWSGRYTKYPAEGGNPHETRPRNIALYCYVKVNR